MKQLFADTLALILLAALFYETMFWWSITPP